MPLAPGTRLGPYEVAEPIGKGGMGEVYRARDTKLDRDVAIKVLPEEFANDDERLARFEREAKLLASLNHPNIASIYGFESGALVLELVEGPTLADRIEQGPIPVDEAMAIARQVVEALEAGHAAGVIHRDLKPANIKLRDDGAVKVLDYGLAKAFEDDAVSGSNAELSQSPTRLRQGSGGQALTRQGTQVGVILGTAAYMSPEQAKGKRVDKRTDIWAFGAVLYEMLTAKRAFAGDDVSETLAAVIRAEPELDELPPQAPKALRRALSLCLTKDARQRIHDMADVRLAMEGAFETSSAPGSTHSAGRRFSVAVLVTGAMAVGIASGVAVRQFGRPPQPPRPVVRLSFELPPDVSLTGANRTHVLALSSDGTSIVYAANERLYLRPLDQIDATAIRGTEGARSPFFSPDGAWVGYWANGELWKVPVVGGAPVSLSAADFPWGVRWGDTGNIVFGSSAKGILQVSSDGGTPELLAPLVATGKQNHSPQILPGEKSVLYTLGDFGAWNDATIVVQSLETGERTIVVEGGQDARYLSSGHLVYVANGTLMAVPFDAARAEVTGSRVALAEDVATEYSGAAHYAVSEAGTVVYLTGSDLVNRTLVWVDREGTEEALGAPPRVYGRPRISPDGARLVVDAYDEERDLWMWDFARETLSRFTFDPSQEAMPEWTPDGSRVVFGSERNGPFNLYWKLASGAGGPERLYESELAQLSAKATPDGAQFVFTQFGGQGIDIGLLTLGGGAEILLGTEFDEAVPELSPDGRWMAYESNASGQTEVYVRPFPNVEDGMWLLSNGGGRRAMWSPDGRELFYMAPGSRLMALPVQTEPNFVAGKAEELFRGYFTGMPGRSFDISSDGERFLMVKESAAGDSAKFVVILNWLEELKRVRTD